MSWVSRSDANPCGRVRPFPSQLRIKAFSGAPRGDVLTSSSWSLHRQESCWNLGGDPPQQAEPSCCVLARWGSCWLCLVSPRACPGGAGVSSECSGFPLDLREGFSLQEPEATGRSFPICWEQSRVPRTIPVVTRDYGEAPSLGAICLLTPSGSSRWIWWYLLPALLGVS